MFKIALVEDDKQDRDSLKQLLLKYSSEKNLLFEINEFVNGEQILTEKMFEPDLIFMDIELGGINGIQTSSKIREKNQNVPIVLITSLAQYAIQGYSVEAIDFIVKPIDAAQLPQKMDGFLKKCRKKRKYINIQGKNQIKKYKISDIHYIEVFKHKLFFHTKSGQESFRGTLREMEEQLNDCGFAKCNKCYLVNLSYVNSIVDDEVEVGTEFLKISRREKKRFIDAFTYYTGD